MAKLLPAGVLVMVESAGLSNTREAIKATDVGRMLAEPVVKQYLDGPGKKMWNAMMALAEGQGGPKARAAVTDSLDVLVRRDWAFALTDLTLEKGQMGNVKPGKVGLVLLCRPGESKAWDRLAGMIQEGFVGMAPMVGMAPNVTRTTIEGVEMAHMHGPVGENGQPTPAVPQVMIGRTKNLAFIVAGMGGSIQETAKFILRAEAGKKNDNISFAECPSCKKSNERVGYAGSLVNVYIAPATILNSAEQAMPAPVVPLIDALGIGEINSAQVTVRAEGPDMVVRAFVNAPTDKGLLRMCGNGTLTAADLKLVPADAKYFEVSKVNFTAMHGYISGVLNAVMKMAPPGSAEMVTGPVNKWLDENGINLKRDLCDALGETVVVCDSPAAGVPLLGGMTIVAEVKDPVRVRKVIAKCMAALEKAINPKIDPNDEFGMMYQRKLFGFTNPEVQKTVYKGTTVHAINVLLASPAFAVTEKHLVITLSVQAAKQTIDFLAGKGGESMADSAKHMAALKPMLEAKGGRAISLAWGENRTAFQDGYNLMLTLAQVGSAVAADNKFPFSSADLPQAEVFGRHIRPTIAVGRIVADGVYVESRGSLPMIIPPTLFSLLSIAPNIASFGFMQYRNMGTMPHMSH